MRNCYVSSNLIDRILAYSCGVGRFVVVEIIPPFKIINLLAHMGLCLHWDDIFRCWCYLGFSRSKFFLEGVEEFTYLFVRHYAQHFA